jgi:hypothetical protein
MGGVGHSRNLVTKIEIFLYKGGKTKKIIRG